VLSSAKLCALLCATLALGGCLQTQKGHPADRRRATIVPRTSVRGELLPRWQRIATGLSGKAALAGYLKTVSEPAGRKVRRTYWVYDNELRARGFFTPDGVSYVVSESGDFTRLGTFTKTDCIAQISRLTGPLRLLPMPPPEGSNAPFYDALKPTKLEGEESQEADDEG
jgi:hypothetical protein